MFHPNEFEFNAAWIAFRLNDAPLRLRIDAEQEGLFDSVALMEAYSTFILAPGVFARTATGPGALEWRSLLERGLDRATRWPRTLYVPSEQPAEFLWEEAQRHGIEVVRVAEAELWPIIGEAKEGYEATLGGIPRGPRVP